MNRRRIQGPVIIFSSGCSDHCLWLLCQNNLKHTDATPVKIPGKRDLKIILEAVNSESFLDLNQTCLDCAWPYEQFRICNKLNLILPGHEGNQLSKVRENNQITVILVIFGIFDPIKTKVKVIANIDHCIYGSSMMFYLSVSFSGDILCHIWRHVLVVTMPYLVVINLC